MTSPVERLLKAVDLIDRRASEATEGPWEAADNAVWPKPYTGSPADDSLAEVLAPGSSNCQADARYIATMHPEVGKAVAAVLREEANMIGLLERAGDMTAGWCNASVLALADLVLAGEQEQVEQEAQ